MLRKLLLERLVCGLDIASALHHCHSQSVIYRDLKPDNIGFSPDGTLKVYDFGLAKHLLEEERDAEQPDLYLMTGVVGSIRYMAPEVGLSLPYNLKSDIYSWAMLMWHILALKPPFALCTHAMHYKRVFVGGERPICKSTWPQEVVNLMEACWLDDIASRPDSHQLKENLLLEAQMVKRHVITSGGGGGDSRTTKSCLGDSDGASSVGLDLSMHSANF